jgi:lysophospholipase L1-like esterase
MVDRRSFLTGSALVAGAATLGSTLNADDDHSPPTGHDGHRLPELKKGTRLLFQGDSITDMKWGRNEKDRNHYLGHSYVYLIAARLGVEMPTAQLDFYNRGISGHKIADLKSRWQKDAIEMEPDVLTILAGINDVSQRGGKQVPLQQWESDYRSILESSHKSNSELRLVLLDPFVLRSGRLTDEAPWKRWRAEVDRLCGIVAGLAVDYDAVHIKTQEIFDTAVKSAPPEHWIWDGVHPLPQGHELIARNWLSKVSARWH